MPTPPSRDASRGIGAAALIVALMVPLHDPAKGSEADGTSAGEISVPMVVRGRIPEVEAWINGEGPWRFLVYAREGDHFIDDDVAGALSLQVRRAGSGDGEGEDPSTGLAGLERLVLGGLELEGVEARISNLSEFFGGDDVPDGVLSLQAFGSRTVTLDFAGGRLIVSQGRLVEEGSTDTLPYRLHIADDGLGEGKVPVFAARVGDRRMDVRLSFGMGGDLLFPLDHMDLLPLQGEPSVIGIARTGEDAFSIQGATLDATVLLGSHAIKEPGARFSEIFADAQIGSHLLEEFSVTFDLSRRLVRFQRDTEAGAPGALPVREIASLDPGRKPLRATFNEEREKVRLVLILSPT